MEGRTTGASLGGARKLRSGAGRRRALDGISSPPARLHASPSSASSSLLSSSPLLPPSSPPLLSSSSSSSDSSPRISRLMAAYSSSCCTNSGSSLNTSRFICRAGGAQRGARQWGAHPGGRVAPPRALRRVANNAGRDAAARGQRCAPPPPPPQPQAPSACWLPPCLRVELVLERNLVRNLVLRLHQLQILLHRHLAAWGQESRGGRVGGSASGQRAAGQRQRLGSVPVAARQQGAPPPRLTPTTWPCAARRGPR